MVSLNPKHDQHIRVVNSARGRREMTECDLQSKDIHSILWTLSMCQSGDYGLLIHVSPIIRGNKNPNPLNQRLENSWSRKNATIIHPQD